MYTIYGIAQFEVRFSPSDLLTDESGDLANPASELWPNAGVVIGFSPANGPLPLSAVAVRRTAFLILIP